MRAIRAAMIGAANGAKLFYIKSFIAPLHILPTVNHMWGGLMMQWAVITSGPSPVSVLVYYPWHRSDCNIREEHSNCCNKTCNLHIEQQTGTWTSQPSEPFIAAGGGGGRVKGGL